LRAVLARKTRLGLENGLHFKRGNAACQGLQGLVSA
jgi:hypothetical protein